MDKGRHEFGIRNAEWGMGGTEFIEFLGFLGFLELIESGESVFWILECGMGSSECGVRNSECGMGVS